MATHRRTPPLIPQRDEPSPFQRGWERSIARSAANESLQRNIQTEVPETSIDRLNRMRSALQVDDAWEITEDEVDFPPQDVNQIAPATVTVTFEEGTANRRAITRPPGYWRMRSGKFLAITDMEDNHLENCIHMCERNAQSRGRRAQGGVYSELLTERQRRRHATQREALNFRMQHEQFVRGMWVGRQALDTPIEYRRVWPDGGAMAAGSPPGELQDAGMYAGLERHPPEPESAPSVIGENRPVRRIKK